MPECIGKENCLCRLISNFLFQFFLTKEKPQVCFATVIIFFVFIILFFLERKRFRVCDESVLGFVIYLFCTKSLSTSFLYIDFVFCKAMAKVIFGQAQEMELYIWALLCFGSTTALVANDIVFMKHCRF